MSVESKKPDPSILRKFELSKKEEGLKQKLFKKTQSNNPSASRSQKLGQHESPKSATLKSDASFKENINVNNTRKDLSVTDEMLGGFLKNMEGEFKELNKKQISMGMLQTQQEIMRKHTEILNENQRNIAQMLKDGSRMNQTMQGGTTKLSEDSQKQLMKEIISPINNQIVEIKKMYEGTKKLAEEVAHSVGNYKTMTERGDTNTFKDPQMYETYQKNLQSTFGNYKEMNSNLKDMVLHAQGNLSQVLPENMQIIKQVSDLNIQAYTDCINTLKKQIEDLQRDAEKAEKELEVRYKKLSQAPKPGTIKPTDPYYQLVVNGPETSEEVIKNIRAIDFQTSHQIVLNKLGGEFDYEQFNFDVSELTKSMYDIRNKALEDLEEHQIDIPSQMELLEYDKQIASSIPQSHSIIDEIKAKYNVPKQMVLPKPPVSSNIAPTFQYEYQESERSDLSNKMSGNLKPKKKTQRPKEFDYIKTIPEEPLPDVQYVREQDPMERMKKRVQFEVEQPKKVSEPSKKAYTPVQREEEFISRETRRPEDDYEERRAEEEQQRRERDLQEELRRENQRKEEPVYINMDRYNVKANTSQEIQPKENQETSFDQVKGTDALFNRLIEGMLLQDIKEQIVFSNIQPNEEAEVPQYIRQEQQPLIQTRETRSSQRESSQLYYPQTIPSSNNTGSIDERLIQQLTLEAISEKLMSSLKSELPEEKEKLSKGSSLFQPVETKSIPELRSQGNTEQANQLAGMFGLNSTQLPTMIAENILGLFNAAMMQINTSLSKNMTQPQQAENLGQRYKENVAKTVAAYSKNPEEQKAQAKPNIPKESLREVYREEPNRSSNTEYKPNLFAKSKPGFAREETAQAQGFDIQQDRDLREQVLIREEKPQRTYAEDRRQGQGGILNALQQEGRNIQEEQDIIRQRKHYVSPGPGLGQSLRSNYGAPSQPGYYFMEHEPQPIANLSEYYRELHSDSSSSDLNNTRGVTPTHRTMQDYSQQERRSRGGRTPSGYDHEILSEGQVFPQYFEGATERTYDSATMDLPQFASTRSAGLGLETDMSMDPRMSTSKRPVITENLFKNLHDEEREPGEISVSDIFKA